MRYSECKTIQQLIEAIQEHIEEGGTNQYEPGWRQTCGGFTVFNMTAARMAYIRLFPENNQDNIPTDAINLLSMCNKAASNKSETAKEKIEPEKRWSRITNKKIIAGVLDITVHKFDVLVEAGQYEIKPAGNQQSWKICTDKLTSSQQKSLT